MWRANQRVRERYKRPLAIGEMLPTRRRSINRAKPL
jgi:hypothetical protein